MAATGFLPCRTARRVSGASGGKMAMRAGRMVRRLLLFSLRDRAFIHSIAAWVVYINLEFLIQSDASPL